MDYIKHKYPSEGYFVVVRLHRIANSTVSFDMSVRPSGWNSSAPTSPIFMGFDIWDYFSKICRENSSFLNTAKLTSTLRGELLWLYVAEFLLEW